MISPAYRKQLTELAHRSIEHGIQHRVGLAVDPGDCPPELCEIRSSFVTLHMGNELRGCVGSLVARLPLVQDVSEHAFAAAFKDPRFNSLAEAELAALKIHLSVLSASEPLQFESEAGLLALLRPGQDGLTIKDGRNHGTFLPSVWEKLPEPREFLVQLKLKAGLAPNYWSDTITIDRYTAESW